MASAVGISVAIESVIHDAFADVVRKISEQHGIQVSSARFEWVDVRSVGGPRESLLSRVAIDSWHELPRK
jgi:hypothetical protein